MPVLATVVRPTANCAKRVTIDAVRKAVLQKPPAQNVSMRRWHVAASLLLSAGIITMLHVHILQIAESAENIVQIRSGLPISLMVLPNATPSQMQMLLQALLALPYVRDVSFTDRVGITPRSIEDIPALLGFLQRSELQSIFAPSAVSQLSLDYERMLALISSERIRTQRAMAGAGASLILLFLAMLLFLRNRGDALREHTRILALFGAAERKLRRPFLHESFLLLGGSFLLAVFCTLVIVVFLGPLPSSLHIIPWVLLLEAATLSVLGWLAVRLGAPFIFISSSVRWHAS